MTRCAKFHHLFDEVGNFCGMSPSAISQYKAYREQVKKIVGASKLEEDFVFEHFSEGPSRVLTRLDDETKTKALNYVTGRLKEGEKITESDLKASIKVWQGVSCSSNARSENFTNVKSVTPVHEVKHVVTLHPNLEVQTLKERFAGDDIKDVSVDTPSNSMALEPPKPKPVPCLNGELCKHLHQTQLGRKCDMCGQFVNQLPGDRCPFDLKEEKAKKESAFIIASEFDPHTGGKIIKGVPYKIVPAPVTKEQFIEAFRGYFTPKSLAAADDLVKLGQLGDDYAELVEALIWDAHQRVA